MLSPMRGVTSMPDPVDRWLPVRGYEGLHEISDQGIARSIERVIPVRAHSKRQAFRTVRERILRPAPMRSGHPAVSLWRENQGQTLEIHSLVAEAFWGLSPGDVRRCHWCGTPTTWTVGALLGPDSLVVDHKDHVVTNNSLLNLLPSCNPCNAHRVKGSEWEPWIPGTQTGRLTLEHPTCRVGHRWTSENTYVSPRTGARTCRICKRITQRKWHDTRRGT